LRRKIKPNSNRNLARFQTGVRHDALMPITVAANPKSYRTEVILLMG
jgi:hypothetical protein